MRIYNLQVLNSEIRLWVNAWVLYQWHAHNDFQVVTSAGATITAACTAIAPYILSWGEYGRAAFYAAQRKWVYGMVFGWHVWIEQEGQCVCAPRLQT